MRIVWKPLGWGTFALLAVVIVFSALMLRYWWSEALKQNGIETLEWQGLDVSLSGLLVHELTLAQSQPTRDVVMHVRELSVGWHWPDWQNLSGVAWRPQLTELTAGHLKLDWYTKAGKQPIAESQPNQWPSELPAWLPSEINVQHFEATLPCEAGRCPLAGSLSITRPHSDQLPIKAKVNLQHEDHQVSILAMLDGSWLDNLNLVAELTIDGIRYLSAKSEYAYQNTNGLVSWDGSVEVPDLPQADWLLAWLKTWQNISFEQWPKQPETGSVEASWQLQGPKGEHFLAQATGSVDIQARVPQPWPILGLGNVSGNAEIALNADHGQWQPETLTADLKLNHPAAWVKKVPELMRPDSLTLSVRPGAAIEPTSKTSSVKAGADQTLLPLDVTLRSRGGAEVSLDSNLAVATSAPWVVQLGKTQVTVILPELNLAGWLLTKPRVNIALTGWLNTTDAALTFGEPTVLKAENLELLSGTTTEAEQDISLKDLRVDLAKTTLKASYKLAEGELSELTLNGPVGVKTKQIKHPQLLPQPWQFNGKLSSNLTRTDVMGVFKANTGTTMNLDVNVPYEGLLKIEGKMRVSGEQEAEALSRTLAAWPSLLTVSGGNVSANVTYKQPQNGAMRLAGKLVFADWSGTYDRTAWSKMNGSAELLLKSDQLSVTTPELAVETVNPGLPVGPVLVAGHYEAPLEHLAAGQLTLKHASSGALGGELHIQPGSWDLARAPVTLPVELNQLSLAHLLQLYPADGLAGTGILSGTVPLLFDPATGISVKKGHIDALKPGGRLQVTAERLKALAGRSESMKLVAQALENFHYSVLDSGIDYGEDGTLMLNLHLEGNSPEVGKGQPVVLNVNLEENIPALLTSLQLSGRVNDAVTERIKKMLQKREQNQSDLLE